MPRYLKVAHQRKSDGSLFTEADLAAQEALVARPAEIYSGPIVAEEMTQEQQAEYWLAGAEGAVVRGSDRRHRRTSSTGCPTSPSRWR